MKVYALFSGEYSDTIFWGVFRSLEKAQQCIADAKMAGETMYCSLGDPDASSGARIECCETDLTWEELKERKWA